MNTPHDRCRACAWCFSVLFLVGLCACGTKQRVPSAKSSGVAAAPPLGGAASRVPTLPLPNVTLRAYKSIRVCTSCLWCLSRAVNDLFPPIFWWAARVGIRAHPQSMTCSRPTATSAAPALTISASRDRTDLYG